VIFGIGSGLSIDRHDAFTARNVAKSLAGFFDPEPSRPGR
jgi:hypothetical protein